MEIAKLLKLNYVTQDKSINYTEQFFTNMMTILEILQITLFLFKYMLVNGNIKNGQLKICVHINRTKGFE